MRAIIALLALCALASSTRAQPLFEGLGDEGIVRRVVRVAAVESGDRIRLADGRRCAIEGIQAPEPETAAGRRARERLAELVGGGEVVLAARRGRRIAPDEDLADLLLGDGRPAAALLLQEGLVRPSFLSGGSIPIATLEAACRKGREARVGLHATRPAERPPELTFHRGVSLGLYSRSQDFDYGPFLREIRDLGASHVLLLTPSFMEHWRSVEILPKEHRTASFETLERVVRQARDLELRVVCMPIVLLETGTKDHWRGDVQPANRLAWFRNYGRLLGRWADVCEAAGASTLLVGSEFSSLESETLQWRALIRSTRQRFQGSLGYSANWDHLRVIRFWDDLDLVGMTGYHSLTKKDDPTVDELVAAWRPIRRRIVDLVRTLDKPFVFSEIGYASQDGINKDPWNYFISETPDPGEQADCYRAFFEAWRDAPPSYRGAYLYNWWQNRDPDDRLNYSLRGKPAEKVVREAYRSR